MIYSLLHCTQRHPNYAGFFKSFSITAGYDDLAALRFEMFGDRETDPGGTTCNKNVLFLIFI